MKTTHKFGHIVTPVTVPVNSLIVQVEQVGDKIFYEVVKETDFYEAVKTGATTQPEAENNEDFVEACETELKADPFRSGWHNGHKLIDIRNNDPEWWAKALKELKNNYIVAKMKVIEEGIANGKIYN